MTKREIAQLIALAAANWPHMQDKNLQATAALWEKALADIPYQVAEQAMVKILSTAEFWPTVAEIRKAALSLVDPVELTAGEAWALILKAAHEGLAYDFNKLPPLVARAARAIGWREICMSENPDAVRAHFMKVYEQLSAREREEKLLPPSVKALTAALAEKKALEGVKRDVLPERTTSIFARLAEPLAESGALHQDNDEHLSGMGC